MKHTRLAGTDIDASAVVLGLMRIRDLQDEEIRTLVGTARDAGVNTFDHADIYGGDHGCERRWGEAVRLSPAEREQVLIQSKVGIRKGFFDFSKEHILASVDDSLEALRTDYLDVLLLHRPDTLMEPEEVAGAFDELHAAGKVRAFGASNQTPGQTELPRRALRQPIVANQVQAEPGARERDRAGHRRQHERAGPVGGPGQRHPRLRAAERHHAAGVVAVPGRLSSEACSSATARTTPS